MNKQEIMDKMVAALMDQERDDVNEYVEKALEAGISPMDILNKVWLPPCRSWAYSSPKRKSSCRSCCWPPTSPWK